MFNDVKELLNSVTKEAFEDGVQLAWEAARKLSIHPSIGGLDDKAYKSMFGDKFRMADQVLNNLTASEAIEKIKAYEEQKNAEDEIKVGDEVYLVDRNHPRVVTCIFTENGCHTKAVQVTESGRYVIDEIRNLQKTGRHFPQIAEVLEKMKEGEG